MSDLTSHQYRQSAIIPYFFDNNKMYVVLVQSKKKKRWIFPKGIIEPDMTPWNSAAKEGYEEAGIEGYVFSDILHTYYASKKGGTSVIYMFPMEVTQIHKSWPEDSFRERVICSREEAYEYIDRMPLKEGLHQIQKYVEEFQVSW